MALAEIFKKTYGLNTVRKIWADPENHVISALDFQLDGFKAYRYSHETYSVRGRSGDSISTIVKTPGRFHIGLVIYDLVGSQLYIVKQNGEEIGRFRANEDDNREWLLFTPELVEVSIGDIITICAEGEGIFDVYSILFMKEEPPIIERKFFIENIRWVVREENGIISCTTTWSTEVELICHDLTVRVTRNTSKGVNHRFEATRLTPGERYTFQFKAPDPHGKQIMEEVTFQVPREPEWKVDEKALPLIIDLPEEIKDMAIPWPISGGIPIPPGEVPNIERVHVLDKEGYPIPAQFKPLSWWEDGSIRWLLVQFYVSDISEAQGYTLRYGGKVTPKRYPDMTVEDEDDTITITQGDYILSIPRRGPYLADIGGEEEYHMEALLSMGGKEYRTYGPRRVTIEEKGPIRTVVKIKGKLKDGAFAFELLFYAYADLPMLLASVALINTYEEDFALVDSWNLSLDVGMSIQKTKLGLKDGVLEAEGASHIYHDRYRLISSGNNSIAKGTLKGWMSCKLPGSQVGVGIRHFAEKYPKGLLCKGERIVMELLAPIQSQWYKGHGGEFEEHGLHFHLLEGKHKLRQGMSIHDELFWAFQNQDYVAEFNEVFNRPPILRTPSRWYLTAQGTRAQGDFVPIDQEVLPEYEERMNLEIEEYLQRRSQDGLYGYPNFGDWYGERGVNWGNNEYDLAYGMFVQYLRSGDPKAYHIAQDMILHFMNIDICHYATNESYIGAIYEHAIGHSGGYYRESPFSSGIGITSPYPVHYGHWNVEALLMHYSLTGDTRALSMAQRAVTRYNREVLQEPYDWFTETRKPGWFLINTMAAYDLTLDPYYLNAATLIVKRVLERQSSYGGWPRLLAGGHCPHDDKPCIGNAGFAVAVLLDGLGMYHRITGCPEVKEGIIQGARFLIREFWNGEMYRYTSCTSMKYAYTMDIGAIISYAAELSGDEELFQIAYRTLKDELKGDFTKIKHQGKSLGNFMRRTPHILAELREYKNL